MSKTDRLWRKERGKRNPRSFNKNPLSPLSVDSFTEPDMMDARLFHTRHLGSYPARCELDDGIAEPHCQQPPWHRLDPTPFISEYEVTAPETLRRRVAGVTPHNDCVRRVPMVTPTTQRKCCYGVFSFPPHTKSVLSEKATRTIEVARRRTWRRERVTHTWLTAACATALRTLTATMRSIARTARSKGSRARFSYGNTR